MAPLPAREPRLRLTGALAGARTAGAWRLILPVLGLAAAYLAFFYVHRMAVDDGLAVSRVPKAVHPSLRVALAAVALFAVTGYGVVRLALPRALRLHEPLWILPAGACASALALTLLGYLHVPYRLNLGIVIGAGVLLSGYAAWRRGALPFGARWQALPWPAYVAALLAFLALIPMLHANFATVIGNGSDSHLAAGSAEFLKHYYPSSVHAGNPVDELPLQWRSKAPIYYVFAAISSLSGLQTFQVLAPLEAILLGLTVVGWFLFAREVLGAGLLVASAAGALVGLDRMVLHTVMHPYYNQTWGMLVIPYGLVLSWWAVESGRARTRGGIVLLLVFLAVCAFAYPLAAPIPLLALVVFAWRARRSARRRGEPLRSLSLRALWRRVYHGPRSLLVIVPLVAVLAVPLRGVVEKLTSGWNVVVNPDISLKGWGGDVFSYFPEHEFFGLPSTAWLIAAAPVLLVAIWLALRRRPGRGGGSSQRARGDELGWGIGAVLVLGLLGAIWFRARAHGQYFDFKILAFVAPVAIVTAVAGLARLRLVGAALIVLWLALAYGGAKDEVTSTFPQLTARVIDLQRLDATLPPGASIRLDMDPALQLWVAYMLPRHPLCSQTPPLDTAYPHVPTSRKADYILADYQLRRPFDAVGPVLRNAGGGQFRLYRERAGSPGPSLCSTARVETVTSISAS